jgi:hypothetical protein
VKQEKKGETKYNKFRRILCGVVVDDVVCSQRILQLLGQSRVN